MKDQLVGMRYRYGRESENSSESVPNIAASWIASYSFGAPTTEMIQKTKSGELCWLVQTEQGTRLVSSAGLRSYSSAERRNTVLARLYKLRWFTNKKILETFAMVVINGHSCQFCLWSRFWTISTFLESFVCMESRGNLFPPQSRLSTTIICDGCHRSASRIWQWIAMRSSLKPVAGK